MLFLALFKTVISVVPHVVGAIMRYVMVTKQATPMHYY